MAVDKTAGGRRNKRSGETESRSKHQQAYEVGVGVAAEGKRVEREGATGQQ